MDKKIYTLVGGRIGTNCYVIVEKNNALIIDLPDSMGGKVSEFCTKNGLNPLAILLTHGHFDHCGGVAEFLRSFQVPVYGHKHDEELAKKASKNKFRVCAEDCDITEFVSDGDCFNFDGLEVSVIHTPGHTLGSVCYLIDGMMFSGDTLFHSCIGRTDFEESNPALMKESLKKLSNIKQDYIVFPGHEESTTLREEQKYNKYLKDEILY